MKRNVKYFQLPAEKRWATIGAICNYNYIPGGAYNNALYEILDIIGTQLSVDIKVKLKAIDSCNEPFIANLRDCYRTNAARRLERKEKFLRGEALDVIWILIDQSNGKGGSKNYCWFFDTKESAILYKKWQSSYSNFAKLTGPFKYIRG